ncbi:Gfo/Idh/MocA family oxidoreductase [Herbiconiux sp. CPCC 203407]|uniref:Gfo/Idh/MocA family oxidoreductase n=1 Tax=Herbiconiux oxytropis TaxID=2970915 RepID=A0AA42BRW7_9MICO|nr:Gfo/Idh/MocA family oxidoreductase [Herbiconiux oxytropis]MCS5721563.1 Gfo/Idh/MocA family oxidoreductase [Herbiconiux oxytropis]MCS5724640.1 Gfo/Idh/MocA family oxidoreductase [Herbiconiux oxytropis]
MNNTFRTLPPPRTSPLRGGPTLRWGIAAPGGIAADFVHALHTHTDQRVVAVGSRSAERAEQFARRHGIARNHGSYTQLFEDPGVQIVYVAAPHSEHRTIALAAVAAGKHVLIEKPIALSAAEAGDIRDAARAAGVFAMEAMFTRFLPQTDVMVQLRDDGVLGDVGLLTADLGFAAEPGGRIHDPALGGGALLDLGVYPVWLSHLWLGAPASVTAVGSLSATGVDEQSALVLQHDSGALAELSTGIRVRSAGRASISGSRGRVDVDPWFIFAGGLEWAPVDPESSVLRFTDESGLLLREGMAWQTAAVAQHVADGLLESPLHPLQTSIDVLTTIDEARRQLHGDDAARHIS